MVDLTQTLQTRGASHGDFTDHARITQSLKNVVAHELDNRHERGQKKLDPCHLEAIDMILHKIGRIIAGDPTFEDHWHDIAGYAKIAGEDKDERKARLRGDK